jgi:hypothetical protein
MNAHGANPTRLSDEALEKMADAIEGCFSVEKIPSEETINEIAQGAWDASPGPDIAESLNGMIEAYWRGSEDSSDAEAPECVKAALNALAALRTTKDPSK